MNKNQMPGEADPSMTLTIEPVQLFDDYFFVGNRLIGAHILKTDLGLVLFDAADDPDFDEKVLRPSLKKLGLEEEKIRMIFLTHGHFDHFLGAEKIRRRTGCQVALSQEDAAFMVWSLDNRGKKPQMYPYITTLVEDGQTLAFGDHSVYVMSAPGHTPGCLNYSFLVHDHGEPHRVMMMGGYGVFGPGVYPEGEYPHSVQYAVEQALTFAASCVKTWEYCKANNCDVYLNPHPHLCDLLKHAEENKSRGADEPNAYVIGLEGVRKWLAERYEVCMESAQQFTDIRKEYL